MSRAKCPPGCGPRSRALPAPGLPAREGGPQPLPGTVSGLLSHLLCPSGGALLACPSPGSLARTGHHTAGAGLARAQGVSTQMGEREQLVCAAGAFSALLVYLQHHQVIPFTDEDTEEQRAVSCLGCRAWESGLGLGPGPGLPAWPSSSSSGSILRSSHRQPASPHGSQLRPQERLQKDVGSDPERGFNRHSDSAPV